MIFRAGLAWVEIAFGPKRPRPKYGFWCRVGRGPILPGLRTNRFTLLNFAEDPEMVGLVLLDLPRGVDGLRASHIAVWRRRSYHPGGGGLTRPSPQGFHKAAVRVRAGLHGRRRRRSGGLHGLLRVHVRLLHQGPQLPDEIGGAESVQQQ